MNIETQKLINLALLFVWIILCLISWTYQNFLYKKIKKLYPAKWRDFGRPSISMMWQGFTNPPWAQAALIKNRLKWAFRMPRYLFKGDPELDTNKEILRLRLINRNIFLAAITVFILYAVIGITLTLTTPISN